MEENKVMEMDQMVESVAELNDISTTYLPEIGGDSEPCSGSGAFAKFVCFCVGTAIGAAGTIGVLMGRKAYKNRKNAEYDFQQMVDEMGCAQGTNRENVTEEDSTETEK